MPFVYSPRYFADIGWHVFPITKYRELYDKLCQDHTFRNEQFVEPLPASRAELALAHSHEYLDDLRCLRCNHRTGASELPITTEIIDLFTLAAGGTILSSQIALEHGWCLHLNGGFHHAFSDRAEGFCYINDLAVAARSVTQRNPGARIAIIDCDLHQGNGTAHIFSDDPSIFTFSIHQRDLYPIKQKSDLDIHLPIHTGDEKYCSLLNDALTNIFSTFQPDFVFYQAGADPYINDQLGSLSLSFAGLTVRDELVLNACKKAGAPVAITLGGGYALERKDTVSIHFNTCLAALKCFRINEFA